MGDMVIFGMLLTLFVEGERKKTMNKYLFMFLHRLETETFA